MGTVEKFGDAERLFYANNRIDQWFKKLSGVAPVKTDLYYNFHP